MTLFSLVAGASAAMPSVASAASLSATNLVVRSAKDGTPITEFRYIINEDNTGTTTQRSPGDGCNPGAAGYPESCQWTSNGTASSAPIVTQGDQSDFAGVGLNLPDGKRYLISVLADGYKLDGAHFSTPLSGNVLVEMEPTVPGLPTSTIQAAVFEDISPVNGAPDLPAEHGLAGFRAGIKDYLGDVTTDVFGNPLCTEYQGGDPEQPILGSGGNCFSKCWVVDNGIDLGVVAPGAGGRCPVDPTGLSFIGGGAVPATAVIEGKVKIPNLGPNRYAMFLTAPDGTTWAQTTTLEGNHDWDAWVMEGATGLDTELAVAGEPFPGIIFGYTPGSLDTVSGGTATISGVVDAVKVYIPTVGGLTVPAGQIWGGVNGAKIDKPIEEPWIALTDLDNGDTAVWVGQGNADGTFSIPGVPDGNYTLTWWDDAQDYILDLQNVTVVNGQSVDMGVLPLTGWWTTYDGYVFNDTNRNGVKDPGEPGVPNYTLTLRKRENSLMDRGTTTVSTDANGYYFFESGYPMTQWLVLEAYNDLYYTTGITYQADNQPDPTTVLGAGVDVSTLPIIGLSGRLDWGVHSYDPTGANGIDPRNGGIVGTVSYDTTRNELDPRYAAVEDWQPGVSGLQVDLYQPLDCLDELGDPIVGAICDADEMYQLDTDGSYKLGPKLNTAITETWSRPGLNDDGECIPRDVDGNRLTYPDKQQITNSDTDCLEAPLMGVQFQKGYSAVDGNYGFGDGCFAPNVLGEDGEGNPICTEDGNPSNTDAWDALPGGSDYLVKVNIPKDEVQNKDLYQFTREEDINIGNGDNFVPQIPPPACAGALHTVDVAGSGVLDGYGELVGNGTNGVPVGVAVPASTPTVNTTFLDIDGSPYEGLAKPLCDTKLVPLANGRSIVPTFNVFTDVPLPGRFWGLVVDDLTFSGDPHQINYGEKAGVPFAPVGIYDFQNRLVHTTESDYSGLFDVLMPSTNRINCPTPSGVCPNVFRFVGNDPGAVGKLNLNYNPRYRTIAAEFEAFPGLIVPADLAPTQVGVTVQLPNGQAAAVQCAPDLDRPQLYAVDRPYAESTGAEAGRTFNIKGKGFGSTPGSVQLDGTIALTTTAANWSDTDIKVIVPTNTVAGPHQLTVTAGNGLSMVNGLTFHVFRGNNNNGGNYRPTLYEVGPGRPTYSPNYSLFLENPPRADHAIQRALTAAANSNSTPDLVIVYPNDATPTNPRFNPRGAYFENLVISAPVSLQGVGPGSPDGSVPGSIIDGSAFGGDGAVADDWRTLVDGLTWGGNQTVQDGAVVTIYGQSGNGNRTFSSSRRAAIDGFDIRGGNQFGFPTNLNVIGGTPTGIAPTVQTQGGAIYANGYARYLQITNNTVQNNGGAYGTIRLGTPDVGDNANDHIRIANNRIVANAGTNLAGAIGVFEGADGYQISHNDICGNFSAEYGGAISVYGRSDAITSGPQAQRAQNNIDHNRIWFNQSYDEGGGVMIAGSLPSNPDALSTGSGPVNVHDNLIQENLSNDDGGGLRFLMAGNFPMKVYNNMIVNNVAAHEGGGVALDDAPDVDFYNNTVMGNLTTATAVTSNGDPAPAGLSTGLNSTPLQATLPGTAPDWSKPNLRNNIFWDNRAGTKSGPGVGGPLVTGLGQALDTTPIVNWDFGSTDASGPLAPTNSVIQQPASVTSPYTSNYTPAPSNVATDPLVAEAYTTQLSFDAWRTNPAFVGAILVTNTPAGTRSGDYHLTATSPARDAGATIAGLTDDIDGDARPSGGAYDAGADEYQAAAVAVAAVTPTTLDLGNAYVGIPSGAQTLTLANTGTADLTGIAVTVTAPFSRPAGAPGGTCGSVVPAGTTCTITVVLTPTATGAATGTVDIGANVTVAGSPVTLAGTGIPVPAKPTPATLDSFNRNNSNTLGGSWQQAVFVGNAGIRLNSNQASCATSGTFSSVLCSSALGSNAYWNGPGAVFGANQAAAFTFANTTLNDNALYLKGSGNLVGGTYENSVRVRYNGGEVIVEAIANNGLTATPLATLTGPAATFANGNTLTALVTPTGDVFVWKTAGATTTLVGHASAGANFTGTGRIGMHLSRGARVDNFAGGTTP